MQEVLEFIFNLLMKYIKIILDIPKINETQTILIFISAGGIVSIIGTLALIKKLKR